MRKNAERIRSLLVPMLLAIFTWSLSVDHEGSGNEAAVYVAEPENTGVNDAARSQQGIPMTLPVVSLQVAGSAPFEAAAFRAGWHPGWMNMP